MSVAGVPAVPALPMVSIILPTFNRLDFLRLAIDSVFAQTYRDWEFIIADDGSDEATRQYLRGVEDPPRIRVLWLEHSGNPGAARNAALAEARGRYVAFMDSDDLWVPHKLETQLAAMSSRGGARRWSYTRYDCVDSGGSRIAVRWKAHEGAIFAQILRIEALIAMPTVIVERTLLVEAGGFDVAQLQHEDYELWLRLILHSEVLLVDEVLAFVRRHDRHYSRGGLWALNWKRRMYEIAAGLDSDAAHERIIRAARARNAGYLVRAYGAQRNFCAALAVLGNSWKFSWSLPMWWYSIACLAGRAVLPGSWLEALRRTQRRARA